MTLYHFFAKGSSVHKKKDRERCGSVPDGQSEAVVKGDARVAQIAAASILAKVERDRQMYELDKQYPEYQFAKHKGYPTKAHLELLQKLPILDCYRKSYGPIKKILAAKDIVVDDQQLWF